MLEDRPIVRFVSKVATQSATAVLAALIGGYVLTALNLRSTEPAREAAKPAAADERALTPRIREVAARGPGWPRRHR